MLRKFLALVLLTALAACSQGDKPATAVSGAGATFPATIYSRWAEGYRRDVGVSFNYQAMGSGAGVKQIQKKTVDFGASDKPLKPEVLDKYGLYQFPTVMGGVVPIVNVKGVAQGQMKLTGAVLGDIFLGKVKTWNDPAIVALNPGLALPATPITVVHRADGSGTTFLFTTYLASQNPQWASDVGASDAVKWPTGLGGKGNDGVAAFVGRIDGTIGYVEFAYAEKSDASYALLQNGAGQYPVPGSASFGAAAASADWEHAPGNYLLLLNQPGQNAWPITGATFIIIYKEQYSPARGLAVLKFFDWAYSNGDEAANELHFVPMPPEVKAMVRKQWTQITADGKPLYVPAQP
ncbi:phosphate ABC transporter substrate-binding protein PstS [Asticcacaulis sp. AC402]|uniref:phosphate ABC transporter substrate-binding protein PstS n=1 Tax=Asticcacaulis sp. AC402 TaxID=1282361 RepID=UPI0004CDE5B8|nr:phosphate ABC transporter substrate-binding protein PstS [Asticcacaulis sp. AC402]